MPQTGHLFLQSARHLVVFHSSGDQPDLRSFPTRRSSDLLPLTRIGRCARGSGVRVTDSGRPKSVTRTPDRKSTRLNSSHANNSYAVFWLKKKKELESVSYRATSQHTEISAGRVD